MLVGILLLSGNVKAATVQGIVYDFSLKPVENVLVEVDSAPVQRMVAQQGYYQFQVPQGTYTLVVKGGKEWSEVLGQEGAEVSTEGVFTIDIILLPAVDETNGDVGQDVAQELQGLLESPRDEAMAMVVVAVLLVIGAGVFFVVTRIKVQPSGVNTESHVREEKVESQEADLDRILEILKAEQGRMNQKDLRKRLPFSEAKLSLIVSELEAKGKVEKIKKGRGNIIVLKNEQ